MQKKGILLGVAGILILSLGYFFFFYKNKTPEHIVKTDSQKTAKYWTCPMHPQIHQDHPGECPICHMHLVPVQDQKYPESGGHDEHTNHDSINNRSDVQMTKEQMKLIGNQKYEVEKMSLKAKIPVSGRMISANAVAFQVYEDDLRYIHPGIEFVGASSSYPEDEVSGKISSVDTIIDPTSRTVRAIGSIQKKTSNLRAEASFRGDILIDIHDKLFIPESSVLHTGDGDLVYTINQENTLKAKKVVLGLKTEGYYEVISGLKDHDEISSGPNFLIDSEAKIRGISGNANKSQEKKCPDGQYWDIPMSMCMPKT